MPHSSADRVGSTSVPDVDVPGAARDTLTIDEAAQRLGLSVKVTRRAAKAGEIPAIRIGRRFLVLRGPFEELVRSQHSSATKKGAG